MKKHLQYIACSIFVVHIFKIQNSEELDHQNKGIMN